MVIVAILLCYLKILGGNIMNRPYIGVTGFCDTEEVKVAEVAAFGFDSHPHPLKDYQLMIGILVSHKTLVGGKSKFPQRYPELKIIKKLLFDSPDILNLVHYNTHNPHFSSELEQICEIAGQNLQGFQLNICWPDPREIEKFKRLNSISTIVLQISKHAFKKVGDQPKALVNKLKNDYSNLIEYALLDPSGGYGKEMDLQKTDDYLSEIHFAGLDQKIGIGIAGGLHAQNLSSIAPLVKKFPNLSIDAEGKLRDNDTDLLKISAMIEYITEAKKVLVK